MVRAEEEAEELNKILPQTCPKSIHIREQTAKAISPPLHL